MPLAWPCASPAQGNVMEEIVVTATRAQRTVADVPSAVSVVTEDDIQLGRQQLGLDEALVQVPGLFMQNRYNFTQDLRVSIRGADRKSTRLNSSHVKISYAVFCLKK